MFTTAATGETISQVSSKRVNGFRNIHNIQGGFFDVGNISDSEVTKWPPADELYMIRR